MSENISQPEFQPIISLESPLQDYKKLIEQKLQSDEHIDDEVMQQNYDKIAAQMRETIWKLLFADAEPKAENLVKAADCLREHKKDACFYAPWDYNDWIPGVRDELLNRKMLDFWRDEVVNNELGPCWAKDSDYFDDMEDERPAEFYKFGGCVAPFSREAKKRPDDDSKKPSEESAAATTSNDDTRMQSPTEGSVDFLAAKIPEKIRLNSPRQDYKLKMEHELSKRNGDDNEFVRIFEEVRHVIWTLLFDSGPLSPERYEEIAFTLQEYKFDACYFNPWDYNEWIVKVRDELFARKDFYFWKLIVERKMGLCCAADSDFFDDSSDPAPEEFYRSGDELMKKENLK